MFHLKIRQLKTTCLSLILLQFVFQAEWKFFVTFKDKMNSQALAVVIDQIEDIKQTY